MKKSKKKPATKRAGVIYDAEGRPFSKWKPAEKFAYVLKREHPEIAEHCELEYRFDDIRMWRFDFCWPSVMVAVEAVGFGWGHQAQQHSAADNEKANRAVELGWRLLRFDSRLLGGKQGVIDAVNQTCRIICGIGGENAGSDRLGGAGVRAADGSP